MKNNYVGENIKIYRERKNYTQKELAEKIGKTWEMVSRYERGESSPFLQLDNLAKALDVDPRDLLRDSSSSDNYSANKVPFFDAIPRNFDFKNSYIFYPAPDWMIRLDRDVFAISMNLIKSKRDDIEELGCIFIAPSIDITKGDLVLRRVNDELVIEELRGKGENILGKVIAKEVRFV